MTARHVGALPLICVRGVGLHAPDVTATAMLPASKSGDGPNNSFKPTPCRGIGHVLYATLAHVRRPATGRLNSGVRRLWRVNERH
jgi:hypothetical protein